MAGKITIRRIGSVGPTLCLLLLVALCVLIGWLTIWGAPELVLRYVERKAADQGIVLRLDALKLEPSHGLAARAEGVRVYASASAEDPLFTAHDVEAGLNVSHLLLGELRPSFLHIGQGALQLPVTEPEGKHLDLSIIHLSAQITEGNKLQLTSGKLLFQGIPFSLRGSCDLAALQKEEKQFETVSPKTQQAKKPGVNIETLLVKHEDTINQIYRHIEAQHWTEEELPALTAQLDIGETITIGLLGNVPKFDLGQFHFRKANLDLRYSNHTISIHNLTFDTVDPETTASLHGSYNLRERRLSFTLDSNAALMRMVRSMSSGPLKEYLYKFRHPDDSPPHIVLSGAIKFEDNYSPESVLLRGSVNQKEILVGNTKVDEVDIAFFYNNGDFNINKFELIFADGSLKGNACAQGGEGEANITADLPVDKILALARELSSRQIKLPQGLRLGERVHLNLHTLLTTPAFKPGQTNWRDYVPSFHKISFNFKTDHLAYQSYELANPLLNIDIANLQQNRNMVPYALGKLTLQLSADSAALATAAGAEPYTLQAPQLKMQAEQVQLNHVALPSSIEQADVSLQLAGAKLPGEKGGTLGPSALTAALDQLKLDDDSNLESLLINQAEMHMQTREAHVAQLELGSLQVDLNSVQNLAPFGSLSKLFSTARLHTLAQKLERGEASINQVEFTCDLQEYAKGSLVLTTTRHEGEPTCTIKAAPDWTNPDSIALNDIEIDLPGSVLSLAMELLKKENPEMQIPEQVNITGSCTLARNHFHPVGGLLHISIPQLVRTPHKQTPFKELQIPIGVQAQVSLSQGNHDTTDYKVNLEVTHETGKFEGQVVGSTAGKVRVTGTNTIRPDIVDKLLDSKDAHSIISDFRFPTGGGATISNIDTRIDYANGELKVESDCDVELKNTEYLISSLTTDKNGKETLRKDLGSNPYTWVTHATCHVHVFVREKRENDKRVPIDSVVTISNAVMDYNNTPWLQRKDIKNGVRNTRLEGETIIIDIQRSFVEIRNVRGTVYPAYSLGMFYPDLQHYMKDVRFSLPVQVSTNKCVFPIYDDCKRPMSGTIRAIAPRGAVFHFLGADIPLDDFSGFVYLTDHYVQLDRMNAKCWKGVLDAAVKIGISGKRTSFDGYAKAQCMNLETIAAAYKSKQQPALCNGYIRFRSPSPDLKALRAYGDISIEDGDLMTLNIFSPVSELITNLPEHFQRLDREASSVSGKKTAEPGFFAKLFTAFSRKLGSAVDKANEGITRGGSYVPGLNHLFAYDLQNAHTRFDIINGHFITRNMKATGYNLNVQTNLDINMVTRDIDGNIWPRISSLPTLLLAPFTFLANFMVDIVIYGTVDDIKWRIGLANKSQNQPPSATSEKDKEALPNKRR